MLLIEGKKALEGMLTVEQQTEEIVKTISPIVRKNSCKLLLVNNLLV